MSKPNSIPLTAERLRELLHYDAETGIFTRRVGRKGFRVGGVAGSDNNGYRIIVIDYKMYRSHRLAWLYMTGNWPTDMLDHINGTRNDNRFANLREATRGENMQNVHKAHNDNKSSGLLGVTFDKSQGKFMARITLNGESQYIGRYTTSKEAHQAYLAVKRELHPFFNI